MIPNLNNTTTTATRRGTWPSKTWVIDRARGRLVQQCDGFESIYQAVQKILQTERYMEPIYSTFYGIELRGMIGKPTSYIRAAIPQAIKEALKQDDRISSVSVEQLTVDGDSVSVTVNVVTNLGSLSVQTSLNL